MNFVRRRRRGIILILVLVIVAMLALISMTFSELMLSERKGAMTSARQSQARALAQSGAELARQFLDLDPSLQDDGGGMYDNPLRFQNILVTDDESPRDRGRFTIIGPLFEDRTITGVRYGLQDESNRINLATILQADKSVKGASKTMLMALPGMTDATANAILDWMDSDETPRDGGAEAEYYGSLNPGYAPRNGPPASIDELLLVRGVTPQLLFGNDAAAMGYTLDASSAEGVDNSDGSMDQGWAAYLTLYSAESSAGAEGTDKINLNDSDLQKLHESLKSALDDQAASFIVAYRAYGPVADSSGSQPPQSQNAAANTTLSDDEIAKLKPNASIGSVLDLIGVSVQIPAGQQQQGGQQGQGGPQSASRRLQSPFADEPSAISGYLPKLMGAVTVQSKNVAGRININQAPRVVLMSIPGITADVVDQIIGKRIPDSSVDTGDHNYEAWPLAEGIVPLKTMKALMPFVTTRGCVYRAHIVGGFDEGAPTARLEVILDAGKPPTKLLSWKDMSRLPTGFPAETFVTRRTAEQP